MPHRVYEVRPKDLAKLEAAFTDDVLSRQSLTVREAKTFGYPDRDTLFVFVAGAEAGLARADEVILEFGRRAADGEALYAKLQEEESEAAAGLGFILGG